MKFPNIFFFSPFHLVSFQCSKIHCLCTTPSVPCNTCPPNTQHQAHLAPEPAPLQNPQFVSQSPQSLMVILKNICNNTVSLTLSSLSNVAPIGNCLTFSCSSCIKEEQVLGGSFFCLVSTNQNLSEISRMPVYETYLIG